MAFTLVFFYFLVHAFVFILAKAVMFTETVRTDWVNASFSASPMPFHFSRRRFLWNPFGNHPPMPPKKILAKTSRLLVLVI